MAKLPDYIDKTDKKAVAAYFIELRRIEEEKKYWNNAIDNDSRGYTTVIADFESYEAPTLKFFKEHGYNPVKIEHLTWKITKPLDV
jgi:hypothetical protein